jgi:hypothetical protein
MWKPWLAGCVSLASIYCGFALTVFPKWGKLPSDVTSPLRTQLFVFCVILAGLGLVGFAYIVYSSGRSAFSILTPVETDYENLSGGNEGLAAGNYLFLLINAFTPALCMWYILNSKKSAIMRFLLVGPPALLVVFFFTTLGFRHRIIILSTSLAATIYLVRRNRPSPLGLLCGCAALVFSAGLIVLTRDYGHGLDLSRVNGLGVLDIFLGGFNDVGTFFTLALTMESIPKIVPFIGFEPFWIAATIPIPRALWFGKPEPSYINMINDLAGTQGQAVPAVGEHYMMFGWPGIVVGGLIFGMIYKGIWSFYRANPENPLVVVIYAVSFGLCFPLTNRGYLPQTLMEYFFALLPVVLMFLVFRASTARPTASGDDAGAKTR